MSQLETASPIVKSRPLPRDMFMPLRLSEIDRGKMLRMLQEKVDDVSRGLDEYVQLTKNTKCKASISLKIELIPAQGADGHVDILFGVEGKLPSRKRRSLYKVGPNGTLLTEATEEKIAARKDEEQIPLFTLIGEQRHVVNPRTMAVVDEKAVAGTINANPA